MPNRKRRDDAVAERFARNLRRERRREGLTQEGLARLAGLHRTEIGRLEGGDRVPKIDTLVKLADSAGVTTAALLDGIYWLPAPQAVDRKLGTFTFSLGYDPLRRDAPAADLGE
jgi:transcriptional regulator with XRE-family HTH domain